MGSCNHNDKSDDDKSKSSLSTPLLKGQPKTINTRYYKGFGKNYDDEALDADFDAETGELSLNYAQNKDWNDDNRPSNKYQLLSITVDNGMINGDPVNLNLTNSKIKYISAPKNLGKESQTTLRKNGFDFNSTLDKWEKGYKGYSINGDILTIDSKIPDSFTGIKKIKTKYGTDTRAIKAAGYKWNSSDKVWEKK